ATLDSLSNPGNVSIVASGDGFDVRLSYTYAEELTGQTFSVSVTDHNAMRSEERRVGKEGGAAVAPSDGQLRTQEATEGAGFRQTVVFQCSDDDPAVAGSECAAAVPTDDATLDSLSNPGNVSIVASGDGFDVRLSYTYAEELTGQTFSVSVTDHNAM